MKLKNIFFSTFILALLVTSCTKEYLNPNAATKDQVLKSADGLMGLVVGTKQQFAVGGTSALYSAVVSNGLSTKELTVLNTGNGDLAAVEAGKGTLGAANATINGIWTSCNLTKANGQLLIDNAQNATEAGTASGIRAYGLFFKALAIGTQALYWEQVPTEVISASDYLGGKRTSFKSRADALTEAVQLLKDADATIKANALSTTFNAKVGTDINLPNTIQALIARFSLMNGKLDDALSAAIGVDTVTKNIISSFKYETVNNNPIFRSALVTNNVVGGIANFGLPTALKPDSTDGRIAFYLGGTGLSKVTGFFKSDLDQIPIYLPSEMKLIKAEVLARQNKIPEAVVELNKIRQKTSDPLSITAKGTAYTGDLTQAAVLTEIYRQRSIELYMTGLRLEDSRRFGRPGPNDSGSERNRNFYPYPSSERDNNSNTPADPTI